MERDALESAGASESGVCESTSTSASAIWDGDNAARGAIVGRAVRDVDSAGCDVSVGDAVGRGVSVAEGVGDGIVVAVGAGVGDGDVIDVAVSVAVGVAATALVGSGPSSIMMPSPGAACSDAGS
jgi:hypothetical protein